MNMNLKNMLYMSALSVAGILNGCKGALPGLQNPEVRTQFEGTYNGKMVGMDVTYVVEKDRCWANYISIEPFSINVNGQKIPAGVKIKNILIEDLGCDNLFDSAPDKYGFVRDREYFQKYFPKKVEETDQVLEIAQKLVRLENKVKE